MRAAENQAVSDREDDQNVWNRSKVKEENTSKSGVCDF
jgi:hypothetical protein